MEKIQIGIRDENVEYGFREICFGICIKNNQVYLTNKNGEISLIGGGIEENETFEDCLHREFLEESGCRVKLIKELYTIDCFWITKTQYHMESLAHFFLVDIEEIGRPSEDGFELILEDISNVLNKLELPYQKKAIELYIDGYKDTIQNL